MIFLTSFLSEDTESCQSQAENSNPDHPGKGSMGTQYEGLTEHFLI